MLNPAQLLYVDLSYIDFISRTEDEKITKDNANTEA